MARQKKFPGARYIVGIDEVGRGSLAGPVVVAAVALPKDLGLRASCLGKLRDSKKLTPKRREEWFHVLKNYPRVGYALGRAYPKTIDRINIAKAANLAALRAYRRLVSRYSLPPPNFKVYLDGGLSLGNLKGVPSTGSNYPANSGQASSWRPITHTIVRGDEKINSIKLASIVAKVSRDRQMKRLAKKYPKYGLEVHKGYGTRKHLWAIQRYGPSEAHRLTFLKKYHTIR